MSKPIFQRPKYESVPYDLHGLSWWQQIVVVWKNPPRLRMLEDWLITLPGGLQIIVPKGFVTDGASIPRLLWWLISPFGPLLEGGILHDFGYQYGFLLSPYTILQPFNIRSFELRREYAEIFGPNIPVYIGRKQIFFDKILKEITVLITGATLQAWVAYVALRWFGDIAWNRYRSEGPTAYTANSLFLPGVDFRGRAIK